MKNTVIPITEGTRINQSFLHGLGGPPNFILTYLLCTTADAASGLVPGQGIPFDGQSLLDLAGAPAFGIVVDATKIYVSYTTLTAGGGNFNIAYLGLTKSLTSFSNFSLSIYYNRFN